MLSSSSIAFLGAGRMAEALLVGFLNSNTVEHQKIIVSSKSGISAQTLAKKVGIQAALNNKEAIQKASLIFLCTKPAQAREVLSENRVALKNKLIISVVAGVSSHDLFTAAGGQVRVIRTMPNTAVRIHKGVTTIAPHQSASKNDLELAKEFFTTLGVVYAIEEIQMNATTAVSGSGPAFTLLFLEGLIQGGLNEGLDPNLARNLAANTIQAAASLILETSESPASLRSEITSPKGTTEAGLCVLEKNNLKTNVSAAVEAAANRAKELAS